MSDLRGVQALSEAKQHLRDTLVPEQKAIDALREMSSGPAAQQILRMQASATAAMTGRQLYFSESHRSLSEMAGAYEQIHRSISEASSISEALFEQSRHAYSEISEQINRMEQFRVPRFEFPSIPEWKFPEPPQVDWDAITARQREGAIKLASEGWTVAAWMPLPDIVNLGEAEEGEIEEYFLSNYLGGDRNVGELRQVSASLLASEEMWKWRNLLEEVFDCFENRKYRVCIPSLLTILEGFMIESLKKEQPLMKRNTTKVKAAVMTAKWHQENNINGVLWMSVVTFFEHLFADSNFDSVAPTFINRHWVLHGRSATNWTVADALKLVNALATLHWFFS